MRSRLDFACVSVPIRARSDQCRETEVRTHRAANALANFGFEELPVSLGFRSFAFEAAARLCELRNRDTRGDPRCPSIFAIPKRRTGSCVSPNGTCRD